MTATGLPVDEAFDARAQLPMLVSELYAKNYRPIDKSERFRSLQEFLDKVSETLGTGGAMDHEKVAHAVLAVVSRQITEGGIGPVRHMTTEDARAFFPRAG